jgi:hypothetical protein
MLREDGKVIWHLPRPWSDGDAALGRISYPGHRGGRLVPKIGRMP